VAKPIVLGSFLGISQDAVGFSRFLETFFGGLVSRIFVGMVLNGLLAIGTLNFLVGSRPGDTEHFVVIALAQSKNLPSAF
jgi:hypothetical protein